MQLNWPRVLLVLLIVALPILRWIVFASRHEAMEFVGEQVSAKDTY